MKNERLLYVIGRIDEDLILEAEQIHPDVSTAKGTGLRWKVWTPVMAAFVLLLIVGVSTRQVWMPTGKGAGTDAAVESEDLEEGYESFSGTMDAVTNAEEDAEVTEEEAEEDMIDMEIAEEEAALASGAEEPSISREADGSYRVSFDGEEPTSITVSFANGASQDEEDMEALSWTSVQVKGMAFNLPKEETEGWIKLTARWEETSEEETWYRWIGEEVQ